VGIAGLTSLKGSRNTAMSFREERIAKNEAVVREINEVIDETRESLRDSSFMYIVCECGYERCDEIIAVMKDEYERIRNDPRQFCATLSRRVARCDGPYADSGRERLRLCQHKRPDELAFCRSSNVEARNEHNGSDRCAR
jgi:hypothetical protein